MCVLERQRKWVRVHRTYIENLVNVLFFQIRSCHHSTVKVDLSFEAHFTQPQVSGLHIVDGSGHSSITQSRLCESQLWRCVCVCVTPLLTSQLGHSPGILSASAHVPPVWSALAGPLC